jgi:hypothetical protein
VSCTSFHRSAKFLAVSVCLAATAFLGGCVEVENAKTIREAQAEFSRAATVENSSLLAAEQGVQANTEAATNYRMAATTLQKLIADKGGNLKKDNLLCTAMIIEALSWWRLGDDDTAMKITNNSSGCVDSSTPAGSQPARDMALFQALPGLIRIDQANQKLANPTTSSFRFNEVMTLLADANTILQTARNQVGTGHPLQLYLIQSQLAIVRNWQYAILKKNPSGQQLICETAHARQQCIKLAAELACAALAVPGTMDSHQQLLEYWQFVAGCPYSANNNPPDPAVLSSPPKSTTQAACAQLNVTGGFPDNCASPTQ